MSRLSPLMSRLSADVEAFHEVVSVREVADGGVTQGRVGSATASGSCPTGKFTLEAMKH
jgi:hypothetical protein